MNPRNYHLIFWDFDGVIKESVDVKTEAFAKLFKAYGQKIVYKVKKHHIENGGMSRFDKIPIYLEWSGINANNDNVKTFTNKFRDLVVQGVIASPWVAGVKKYIYHNHKLQKFVLVTATPKKEIDYILTVLDIKDKFDSIYGSPKSKYSAINDILGKYDIDLRKCLMIGDSYADYQAAKDNNIDFLLRIHPFNENIFQNYQKEFIKDFSLL